MSPSEDFVNIADANHPNAGRIYDFLLGGNHNFEIDRKAAQSLLDLVPTMPYMMRLIRWFLGEAVRRLSAEGYRIFLDFASGLPTVDHIHQVTPKGTRVVYSDIDPVTVAYAQDIIKGNDNVRFIRCDASRPEELLESDAVRELVGNERKVAIGFNGIAWFLPDEVIAHFMRTAYDWAAPGSALYLCDIDIGDTTTPAFQKFADHYRKLKQPFYNRPNSRLQELITPWKIMEPGFQTLETWIDLKENFQKDMVESLDGGGGELGAILKK